MGRKNVVDFREVKEVVEKVSNELTERDNNWKWKVDVLKSKIRVWWGYLQYCDGMDSHFTIEMDGVEYMVARDEHDVYMCDRLVGIDGDFQTCVVELIKEIAFIAHNRY